MSVGEVLGRVLLLLRMRMELRMLIWLLKELLLWRMSVSGELKLECRFMFWVLLVRLFLM